MVSKKKIPGKFVIALSLILIGLSACNMPRKDQATEPPSGYIYTAAAETVQAQLTQVNKPPATVEGQTPLPSPQQTTTPLSVTGTPLPTTDATSGAPDECDLGKFVKDINIPDGTEMSPGNAFEKSWRLRNTGTCTWNDQYQVVFEGENDFNAPASIPLTAAPVPPEETVDITVTMQAPEEPGTYRQDFYLVNAEGKRFGLKDGTKPFWVQVEVVADSGIVYDLLTSASSADWKSGKGNNLDTDLPFGGSEDDPHGAATIKDGVKLENGSDSSKLLLTYPKHVTEGIVAGFYPEYSVRSGDQFKARLGFMVGEDGNCHEGEVVFQVGYQEGSDIYSLGEWKKRCDGTLVPVNINLSTIQSKNVQIVLIVKADGSYNDDWAVWSSPRIER